MLALFSLLQPKDFNEKYARGLPAESPPRKPKIVDVTRDTHGLWSLQLNFLFQRIALSKCFQKFKFSSVVEEIEENAKLLSAACKELHNQEIPKDLLKTCKIELVFDKQLNLWTLQMCLHPIVWYEYVREKDKELAITNGKQLIEDLHTNQNSGEYYPNPVEPNFL